MSTKRDQQKLFNQAVRRTEVALRQQQTLYEEFSDFLETNIARLRQDAERGKFDTTNENRQTIVDNFIKKIASTLAETKQKQFNIIKDGYKDNFVNTYYGLGYSITNDVNERVLSDTNFDYVPDYRKINTSFVESNYANDLFIASFGLTISERARQETVALLAKLRQSLTGLFRDDLTKKDIKNVLDNISGDISKDVNSVIRTTRTEVLTGHSGGAVEAIEVAEDSGVFGVNVWDATLDGFTRPTHRAKDQTEPGIDGQFVFPDGSFGRAPRDTTLSAGERINCRCYLVYLPNGVTPNSRGERLADGTWAETGGKMNFAEWAETLKGRRSIEAAEEYNKKRANRLKKRRREGKEPLKREPVSRRLRK